MEVKFKKDPDKILRLGMSHAPEGREVFPYCSVMKIFKWVLIHDQIRKK